MKSKSLIICLSSVLFCTIVIVFANEVQTTETKVANEELQSSLLELGQDVRSEAQTTISETKKSIDTETAPTGIDLNEQTATDQLSAKQIETTVDTNQNITTDSFNPPKRQMVTTVSEEISVSEDTFDESYSLPLTIEQLENYSCLAESLEFGHNDATGTLSHEILCEFQKLVHYVIIACQNLKTELQLELPIETEEAIIFITDILMKGTLFDDIEKIIVQWEVYLENPQNLKALFDVIEKCIPIPRIHESLNNLRIAITNFFVHVQGLVIYLEPHETVQNYVELIKVFGAKIQDIVRQISDSFDIHIEKDMDFLLRLTLLARLFSDKFSVDLTFEQNLMTLKEFVDAFVELYQEYYATQSSESLIVKLHMLLSNFILNWFPYVPVLHLVPSNSTNISGTSIVPVLTCTWDVMNGIPSVSALLPTNCIVTSIPKDVTNNLISGLLANVANSPENILPALTSKGPTENDEISAPPLTSIPTELPPITDNPSNDLSPTSKKITSTVVEKKESISETPESITPSPLASASDLLESNDKSPSDSVSSTISALNTMMLSDNDSPIDYLSSQSKTIRSSPKDSVYPAPTAPTVLPSSLTGSSTVNNKAQFTSSSVKVKDNSSPLAGITNPQSDSLFKPSHSFPSNAAHINSPLNAQLGNNSAILPPIPLLTPRTGMQNEQRYPPILAPSSGFLAHLPSNSPPASSPSLARLISLLNRNPAAPSSSSGRLLELLDDNPSSPSARPVISLNNNPPISSPSFDDSTEPLDNSQPISPPLPERVVDHTDDNTSVDSVSSKRVEEVKEVEKSYDKYTNPLVPAGSWVPVPVPVPNREMIPNVPRYLPLTESYVNYLESADAFYRNLYSYIQYGNPAVLPPPQAMNRIGGLLGRGSPMSLPIAMGESNACGTSAFLSSLSGLDNVLKNDVKSSQLPVYIPRKEIASALGNIALSPGDLVVILPKDGIGLIGYVNDAVGPIYFKIYELKTLFADAQDSIKIWHLRSGDFRNPACEQQLELLFKRY